MISGGKNVNCTGWDPDFCVINGLFILIFEYLKSQNLKFMKYLKYEKKTTFKGLKKTAWTPAINSHFLNLYLCELMLYRSLIS